MRKLAILYDASQAVLSTFDVDEVLRRILSIIRDYFQVPHSAVLLVDESTRELCLRSHSGWPPGTPEVRLAEGKGICGEAARLRRPIYVADVHNEPRYVETLADTQSELAIPLMVQERVVGVLDCQGARRDFFDSETIDLLTLFSTQASIALQNARLHALERRRAAQLEAINAIARQTTALTDLPELLARTCSLVRQSFQVDHVTVLLLEEHRLVLRAHEGELTLRLAEGADLPASAGLCGRALRNRAPLLANDVSREPDYIAGLAEARSELCLPLISFGQPLGVLLLSSARLQAFSETDLGPMESVADICAAAFQNVMNLERVRQLAYRDGLTGIFNRRFFEMRILEELERARRYNLVLSVVMVDLDGFKILNDEFGHLLGDEALRQMTTIFSQQMRKADVVCRYGGDEFAILLPETGGQKAFSATEKLRRTVAAWAFPGVPRPLTLSGGIACFPEHGNTRDLLIKAADDALYRAKQTGRNRVLFAGKQFGIATAE
jgi:diguanylate cyclase (GGDEF)-like protein